MVVQDHCRVQPPEGASYEARCWLLLCEGEFRVEDPEAQRVAAAAAIPVLGARDFRFTDAQFTTYWGQMRGQEITVLSNTKRPYRRSESSEIGPNGEIIPILGPAPVWTFVPNRHLRLTSESMAELQVIQPGQKIYGPINLCCGGKLPGTQEYLTIEASPEFGEPHLLALSLALGFPLVKSLQQQGHEVDIFPTTISPGIKPRPLFDEAVGGRRNDAKYAEGVSEIYRAALDFARSQPDCGVNFRLALDAFLTARSMNVGYVLSLTGPYHLLEWLDRVGVMNAEAFAKISGLPKDVAIKVVELRNRLFHHADKNVPDEGERDFGPKDLTEKVDEVALPLARRGYLLPNDDVELRSLVVKTFVASLTGRLLLEMIGAKVTPAKYMPSPHLLSF